MCFVDSAYVNEPTKKISTTGFAFKFYGGEVVYRSKLNISLLSSMEEDLISAVNSSKADRFLRYMLQELGFAQ